jgi:hypothetical protein
MVLPETGAHGPGRGGPPLLAIDLAAGHRPGLRQRPALDPDLGALLKMPIVTPLPFDNQLEFKFLELSERLAED